MSLSQLYVAVITTGNMAAKETDPTRLTQIAHATVELAQAYQLMKECELHEKFHMDGHKPDEFRIPGEGPIEKGPN